MSEFFGAILGVSALMAVAVWAMYSEYKRSKAYIAKEQEQTLLYKKLLKKLEEC